MQLNLAMTKLRDINRDSIDKIAKKLAPQLIKFCQQNESFLPPGTSLFNYSPDCTIHIFNNLKSASIEALQLKEINKDNYLKQFEKLDGAIKVTFTWICDGIEIMKDKNQTTLSSLPFSYFLKAFENECKNQKILNILYVAYYVLCLISIFEFSKEWKNSYLPKSEFKKLQPATKSYRGIIRALGCIISAQAASEYAVSTLEKAKGKQIPDGLLELADFGRGKIKIDKHNINQSKNAKEKWLPLINEVDSLIEEKNSKGKNISKRNAVEIVVNKHNKNLPEEEKIKQSTLYRKLYA